MTKALMLERLNASMNKATEASTLAKCVRHTLQEELKLEHLVNEAKSSKGYASTSSILTAAHADYQQRYSESVRNSSLSRRERLAAQSAAVRASNAAAALSASNDPLSDVHSWLSHRDSLVRSAVNDSVPHYTDDDGSPASSVIPIELVKSRSFCGDKKDREFVDSPVKRPSQLAIQRRPSLRSFRLAPAGLAVARAERPAEQVAPAAAVSPLAHPVQPAASSSTDTDDMDVDKILETFTKQSRRIRHRKA